MKISKYMNRNAVTASPSMGVLEILHLMKESRHDGFPVVENGKVVGMLTYSDVILEPMERTARDIMETRVVAVTEDMDVNAAARLLFRQGYSRVPVIKEDGTFLGLITNKDVMRAHIERVTPLKVDTLKNMIEHFHNVKVKVSEEDVSLSSLRPTQDKTYVDELKTREYELERGLAEALLVIKNGSRLILVDGHHRALAARKKGQENMAAFILTLSKEVPLGLEKTADKLGINTLDDIKVLDGLTPYKLPLVLENGKVTQLT